MKRIISGKTYNTLTATVVGRYEQVDPDDKQSRTECILYVTRGGAFFLHVHDQDPYRRGDRRMVHPITR